MEKKFAEGDHQRDKHLFGIGIEGGIRNKLETIITWSKITSVGGFVNLGLNFLSTVLIFSNDIYRDVTWVALGATISLVISFFLNLFLLRFSNYLKTSLNNDNQEHFVAAAHQLKAYMRMAGILIIVTILLAIISYGFIFTVSRRLYDKG